MDELAVFQKLWQEYRQMWQTESWHEWLRLSCHMSFAEQIRTHRLALRMTQKQFARILGISTRTLIRHERGQSVGMRADGWGLFIRLQAAHAAELVAYVQGMEASASATIAVASPMCSDTRFGQSLP